MKNVWSSFLFLVIFGEVFIFFGFHDFNSWCINKIWQKISKDWKYNACFAPFLDISTALFYRIEIGGMQWTSSQSGFKPVITALGSANTGCALTTGTGTASEGQSILSSSPLFVNLHRFKYNLADTYSVRSCYIRHHIFIEDVMWRCLQLLAHQTAAQ